MHLFIMTMLAVIYKQSAKKEESHPPIAGGSLRYAPHPLGA